MKPVLSPDMHGTFPCCGRLPNTSWIDRKCGKKILDLLMFVSPQDRKSAQHRIHSNAVGTTKFTRETVVSHHCRLTLFFKSHVKAVVNI